MINIAICDDDVEILDKIYTVVSDNFLKRNAEFKIQQFQNGMVLLEYTGIIMFDLVFLDINMPDISGIDVADKIKAKNRDIEIIFISNRYDLMGKAIHYSPFRFIEKANLYNDMPEAIEAYINKITNESLLFKFDIKNHESIKISVKNILYLESIGHNIKVKYVKSYFEDCYYIESVFRGNLYEFEERWVSFGFVRASKSYLVNIKYIKDLKSDGIILDNNDVIAISRIYYDNVKEIYFKYVRRYSYGER